MARASYHARRPRKAGKAGTASRPCLDIVNSADEKTRSGGSRKLAHPQDQRHDRASAPHGVPQPKHIYAQVDRRRRRQDARARLDPREGRSRPQLPARRRRRRAKKVGKAIARSCKAKNIDEVVFDRNGYLYHGRVKALAEGAREAGLSSRGTIGMPIDP